MKKFKDGSIGQAIEAVREGAKVRRSGWGDGSLRYVFLQRGAQLEAIADDGEVMPVRLADHLMMRLADGVTFEPYAPTSSDLLASDWESTTMVGIDWDAWDEFGQMGEPL